jgi:transcription termination factor NusB
MYTTLNVYTKKLSIDHCDRIDQAIFLLGYVEYQTLKTPKNVLINEMIELSKRYSDP